MTGMEPVDGYAALDRAHARVLLAALFVFTLGALLIAPALQGQTGDPAEPTPPLTESTDPSPEGKDPTLVGKIQFPPGERSAVIELKRFLQIVSEATGRTIIYPSTTADPNFGDDVKIEVLGEINPLTLDVAEQILSANGYELWEESQPGGIRNYELRHSASRVNPPLTNKGEVISELPQSMEFNRQIMTLVVALRHTESTVVVNTLREILDFSGAKSQTGVTKIVTVPDNQTLIIKGKVETLRYIKQLLTVIDVEIQGPEPLMEVRELYYADALDMVDILQQALDSAAQPGTGTPTAGQTPTPAGRRGRTARTAGLRGTPIGVATSLIPDTRTQKILIQSTSPEEVQLVHVLIDELDTKVRNIRSKTHVYKVRYLKAEDLRDTVTQLIDGAQGSLTGRTGGTTRTTRAAGTRAGQQQTQGQPLVPSRIVAHSETNSLLIQAEPEEYEEIHDILEAIDRKRRQVFLEAALLQVSESSDLNYTFEYLAGNLDDQATRFAALSSFGLTGLDTSQLPNNFTRLFPDDGGGLNGLVAAVSRDGQLPVILQAVKSDTDSKILATPFILADDNQENEISVLTTVYFTQTAQGQVTATTGQDSDDAGITLRLIPTVSGSVVLLELEMEVSDFGRARSGDGALPDKSTNRITSRVTIPDGEIFIIGGLARENESVAVSKIPILGDLPIIGRLFQSRGSSKSRDNLYVLLTAHIIDDPENEDLRKLTEQAIGDMKTFEEDINVQRFEPFNRDRRRQEIEQSADGRGGN